MKYSLLLCLLILSRQSLSAQIWAEIISRQDTFALLGSGSDNKVRIHNLPAGAVVSIRGGAADHLSGEEYVLCRFHKSLYNNFTSLSVKVNNAVIYSKSYKIKNTRPSGSIYNPVLHILLSKNLPDQSMDHDADVETMSYPDLKKVLLKKQLLLSDTACSISVMSFCVLPQGGDFIGPFLIDPHYLSCGYVSPNAVIGVNDRLIKYLDMYKIKARDRIFLNEIEATCPADGTYTVKDKHVLIQ